MIELYTAPTPNGHKISIALEEMGLEYRVHEIDLSAEEQKQPEFIAINPNGRIPAIIDRENNDFAVFEPGAILLYLAEKSGKFLPGDPNKRSKVVQWLMFQMGGAGPMMGQDNAFYHDNPEPDFPEPVHSVIERYQHEGRRLFEIMDRQLAKHAYIAGDEYTIADMAAWPWVRIHDWNGIDTEGLDHLQRWLNELAERPACQKGIVTPPANELSDEEQAKEILKMVTR